LERRLSVGTGICSYVDEKQVKEARGTTMLNVLGVLKNTVGGDLNRIKKCVQLTGYFNLPDNMLT